MRGNCRGRGAQRGAAAAATPGPGLTRGSEDGSGGEEDNASNSGEPTLRELADLLRTHIVAQEARETQRIQELGEQDRRFDALRHQFGLLRQDVAGQPPPVPLGGARGGPGYEVGGEADPNEPPPRGPRPGRYAEPKLQKLSDSDDVEHFLITFERVAAACQWPRGDWSLHLVPLLTGKARGAYVHMEGDDTLNYDRVKAAILRKYDINPETYRQRFRSLDVGPEESPKELYVRLKENYVKWIQPRGKTVAEINELLILEQYLRMLSPELQVWVKEHNPESAVDAAELADVFVAARRKGQQWSYNAWRTPREPRKPQSQHMQRYPQGFGKPPFQETPTSASKPTGRVPVCYQCGEEGHIKPRCPRGAAKVNHACHVPRPQAESGETAQQMPHMINVQVHGKEFQALVDSGSDQTLVHQECIAYDIVQNNNCIPVRCVHGDEKLIPTADVYLKVQDQTYLMTVGVADNLPFPVVLGRDLPVLPDLLQRKQTCNVAMTRSQSKKGEKSPPWVSVLPFYDADLENTPGRSRKSRSHRREDKFQYTVSHQSSESPLTPPLEFKLPVNIIEMQNEDPTLASYMQKAKEQEGKPRPDQDAGEWYFLKDGVLYRQSGPSAQLMVPQGARGTVLTLGHSIPWAGHLGKNKTVARIKRHFFWPGIGGAVAQFCRSCPECQQAPVKGPPRAPLQPLPIISVPFQRLGMDVVGPVEKTKAGNRFMLVVTDYATKYPEVFPLKSVKARYVAACLVQLFSRVGFPCEILTDQGSNFMSTLLKQVYHLLGIKSLRTTPYHPQTDGLTERFNQTIKHMLRKFVNETGSNWDQWLPYLLFAYREVPQSSTGFSPFELLYGREVRGPLTLLKELWEGGRGGEEPVEVVSYVLQMRERLEKMSALAEAHMADVQKRQKTWYDQTARHRIFSPGQKVLVLLPSQESKLLVKWQGPYEVQKRLGPTTYEIATPGRGRSTKVLHVNLLKEWISRPEGKEVMLIRRIDEEEDMDDQYLPVAAPVVLDVEHLADEQQSQVRALCNPLLFSENPGRTNLVEHNITLKSDAVVRRMSYRIPERLQESLKKEVDLMLSSGVIERSQSEWCHPVVLVPKKDGSVRFCIDFRYLNSVSKFDSYPTPRIDDLIERLGKSQFLTTIDLCKGYWQIPLTKNSCELTAFRTPWGLFHFTVLPFGLHGAPAAFQRMMDEVLHGLSDFASAYLDDIVIHSTTWGDHLEHLKEVLDRLQSAGLTINASKCGFARAETEYLGFTVGKGTVKPQLQKVHAIENCPLPQTRKQLRSFIGMAGFYQRFIPHFSARAAPLTDRVGSRCPNRVQWSEEAVAAFHDLRQALSQSAVLRSPDFDQPFVLQTDASDRGLGGVLLQGPPEDRHPVAYISRKMVPREVRYSTVEKEALAIKWALDSFKYYLLGREFVLETDHRALQWLARMKDTNGRITRWYLALQPYRFAVAHIPGKSNATADFLSRSHGEFPEGGESVMDADASTPQ